MQATRRVSGWLDIPNIPINSSDNGYIYDQRVKLPEEAQEIILDRVEEGEQATRRGDRAIVGVRIIGTWQDCNTLQPAENGYSLIPIIQIKRVGAFLGGPVVRIMGILETTGAKRLFRGLFTDAAVERQF